MNNPSLNDLSVFAEVVRANGFRAAADKLNIGAGSVSETVKRIEMCLGVRLIERTTRKMSLTSAGQRLYQQTVPALLALEASIANFEPDPQRVAGLLRLSAPRSSASFFLERVICELTQRHPDIRVEVMYDDRKVDLVASGVDAAVRSRTLLENDTHAVDIGPELKLALVASPDYLARHGVPGKPADVSRHDAVCFAFDQPDRLAPWTFLRGAQAPYVVAPNPRLIVNDLNSLLKFACAGLGLAYVYRESAEPLLASGQLLSLLDKQLPQLPRYTINYLTKRHMPARLRAFIDLARQA